MARPHIFLNGFIISSMNLKTVVDSILESLKEKGLDEESISQILYTWQLREGITNLDEEAYSRDKIKSLFDIIDTHLKVEKESLETSEEPVESFDLEEEPLEEEALEKELEELVRLLTAEPISEEVSQTTEPEEIEEPKEPESEIERELRDFAEFLKRTQEKLVEEEPITIPEEVEEETGTKEPVKIVEEEEEQKLKSLVEELVEETRSTSVEPQFDSDIDIKGLRMAAVIEGDEVRKLVIFRKPEGEYNIPALIKTLKRLWELTGYEIHDLDSFHIRSGAVVLYVEKIEGIYYLAVVESETVGGARFIAHALKRLIK